MKFESISKKELSKFDWKKARITTRKDKILSEGFILVYNWNKQENRFLY